MSTAKTTQSPNSFDPDQTYCLVKVPAKGEADSFMVDSVNGSTSGFELLSKQDEKLTFSYSLSSDSGAFIYGPDNVGTEVTYTDAKGNTISGASFGRFIVTITGLTHEGELTGVTLGQGENTVLLNGSFNITFAK
ncbi:hypothetical protein [Pseudomonas tolaasii]|uniref:hypothetical protein n=1 Tax=Pseudomonas tolaasii TaxID=29442 RepID=UPI000363A439|nr:hypothetical protein [Pseudomonas tolaasii]